MGGDYPDMPERYEQASPVTHLSADDPPVLMTHGTADRTVPYSQATLLETAMEEAGVPCELLSFEGAGHGLKGIGRDERREVNRYTMQWILKHLGVSEAPEAP
jgi:dipeptidyl aminopeptidase/acylaminoacyl peptidase